MKISLFLSLLAASNVSAEEGGLRQRILAGASGSINVPTCFPEDANVQVFGKGAVEMKNLHVGDRIFTGDGYEPIYAFAHLDKDSEADFVQIQMANGNALEVTGPHLVFVDGKSTPVRADSIKVGDVLQGTAATNIEKVQKTGLYAPLTVNGKLVVDGVLASNYVSLDKADNHAIYGMNVHGFSHLGISPIRLICTTTSLGMCTSYTNDGILAVLDSAHKTFDYVMSLPAVFQAVVGLVHIVIAAMAWTLECVVVYPQTLMILGVIGFVSMTTNIRIQANKVKKAV